MIKYILTLLLTLLPQLSWATSAACLPATSCAAVIHPENGSFEGCTVYANQFCNMTAWNANDNRWDCTYITNNTGNIMFAPGQGMDYYNFMVSDWLGSTKQTAVGAGQNCNMSAVDCPARPVTWGSCQANITSGSLGATSTANDGSAPGVGSANFICQNGSWIYQSGNCGCTAGQGVSWTSSNGRNCSGTVASSGSDGQTVGVNNSAGGVSGSANFVCSGGSWIISGGGTCLADCGNPGLRWGSGNECGNSPGNQAHGTTVNIANAIGGWNGSARFSCNDGNWTGPNSGWICNPNVSCEAGAMYNGPGGATPTSGCRCSTSGQYWCLSTQQCDGLGCEWGASPTGAGAGTSIAGCRCNNAGENWNGSYCYSCPGGTSPGGAGAAVNSNCRCDNSGWNWNGATCVAPPDCTDGSIRTNPSTYASEVCNGGYWVNRPLQTFCTPPIRIDVDDDSRVWFHDSVFGLQGSRCFPAQVKSFNDSHMNGDGSVGDDDNSRACSNYANCLTWSSTPIANATCPALTIGWAMGGYACYATVPATGSTGSASLVDNTGPDTGTAFASCKHGVWSITPYTCHVNCQVYTGVYGDTAICTKNSAASSCSCGSNCYGVDGACPW